MALSTRSGELLKRGAAERFHEAAQALYKVIEKPRYERIKVQFETILTEESRIPELTKLVEGLVEAGLEKTRGHSETSKLIIANIFKSSYPFLRQLLAVGQTGASILNPYGLLFAGVILLLDAGNDAIRKKENVNEVFQRLLFAVHRIQLTSELPESLAVTNELATVQCAALDICTAIVNHITPALKILYGSLRENFTRSLFGGKVNYEDRCRKLNTAIDNYTSAVGDLGCRLELKLLTIATQLQSSSRPSPTVPQTSPSTPLLPLTFSVPYERNNSFTGRQSILESIRHLFLNKERRLGGRVALYGLPGIGKTQIALEYLHLYRSTYSKIYWLNASQRSHLISELAALQSPTGFAPFEEERPMEERAEQVLSWLGLEEGWLLILDNVDDFKDIHRILQKIGSAGGDILITTINRNVHQIPSEGIEVSALTEPEAFELLFHVSDRNPADEGIANEGREIVKTLGCFPLAINLAGTFIRVSNCSTFLEILRLGAMEFYGEIPQGKDAYPKSVYAMFSACICRLSPNAKTLIELFSFLNPDGISVQFLEAGSRLISDDMKRILLNKFNFLKGLQELEAFSFIKVLENGEKVICHRLLQAVIRKSLARDRSLPLQFEILNMGVSAFSYSLETLTAASRAQSRRYFPQINAALNHFDSEVYQKFAISPLAEKVTDFLCEDYELPECARLIRSIIIECRCILGRQHPITLRRNQTLGTVYLRLGRNHLTQAIALLEETAQEQKHVLEPGDPEILATQQSLAEAYHAAGKIDESCHLLQHIYSSRLKDLGALNIFTLRSKFHLSILLFLVHSEDGLRMLRETHEERLKLLGDSHQDTLLCMHALARVWCREDRIEDALEQYRSTYTAMARMFGSNHPYTASVEFGLKKCEAKWEDLKETKRRKGKNVRRTICPEDIAENYYYFACIHGCWSSTLVDGICTSCGCSL